MDVWNWWEAGSSFRHSMDANNCRRLTGANSCRRLTDANNFRRRSVSNHHPHGFRLRLPSLHRAP
jgi:hypothetical protein